MSQISPPIRILLVCAIAFLGAYMLFLRPKEEVIPPADPAPNVQTGQPAVSDPGKVAQAAQGAVEAANGQLAQQESVDGADAGEAAAGTQTAAKSGKSSKGAAASTLPAADLQGLPKPVKTAIRKGQVLVLLFWNGKSADDIAVHDALAKVDRWDGRVSVQSASIKKISKYGRIARGVEVEQSPTVVVADRQLRAETLVGYVDTRTIDQSVVDALRNSTGLFTDSYLRKIDAVCRDYRGTLNRIPHRFAQSSPREFVAMVGRMKAVYPKWAAAMAAVKAPKRWKAFRAANIRDMKLGKQMWTDLAAYLGTSPSRSRIVTGLRRANAQIKGVGFKKRMQRERLDRCID